MRTALTFIFALLVLFAYGFQGKLNLTASNNVSKSEAPTLRRDSVTTHGKGNIKTIKSNKTKSHRIKKPLY